MSLFRRKGDVQVKEHTTIDTTVLDESLRLISTTAAEVSTAAVKAARVLQEQLHDSESRFFSTIDSIQDIIIVKDGEGRWITVNKQAQELYGWYHGEYYGKTDWQLSQEFPRLAQSLQKCSETDNLAWDSRLATRTEEMASAGIHTYYYDVIKTPVFHSDGSRKELIIVGRDVTESRVKHKRTKACFSALNAASDIIFILDSRMKLFFCNDQFIQKFEIKDYNDVVGEDIHNVIKDLHNPTELWHTISQNKTWEDTYREKCRLTILPMMNGSLNPIYYIGTIKLFEKQ